MLSVTAVRRLAALSVVFVCACARTTDSTETGNPPVIDAELIALVAEDGEVHVVGEPRAVMPGGAELEVETLASGEVARTTVDRDGSFDVAVEGTLDDTYRLRAVASGSVSEPVYLDRDGATEPPAGDAGADGGTLTCAGQVELIRERIEQVEAQTDRTCSSSYDCGELPAPNLCPYFCRGVALAHAAQPEVEPALEAIGTDLCAPFDADGCYDGLPVPECAIAPPIACVDQACTRCEGGACPETSCEPCNTPLVTWSTRGSTEGPGVSGATYRLEGCSTLTFTPVGDLPSCTRTLPCVPRSETDLAYTAAHVQNALGHPEVQEALAAGMSFGALTPGGFGFSFGVGDASIFVSEIACEGAASCTDVPEAVDRLRTVLENIAPCDSGTPVAPECTLEFDPGTGSAGEHVYAFDPAIGTCVPESYGGEGGNANRFATHDACLARCPTTAAADACPADRVFVELQCVECGPVGCMAAAPICGLPCEDGADCEDELGTCGANGVCGPGICF